VVLLEKIFMRVSFQIESDNAKVPEVNAIC